MSSASPQTGARKYRSRLDLVASDEMLAMLLRGMGRLCRELEAAQKEQARLRTAVPAAVAAIDEPLLQTVPEIDEQEERVWFYADDMSATAVPAGVLD